jgi:hypothetical protein
VPSDYTRVGTVEDSNGVKVNIGVDDEGDLILSGVLIRTIRLGPEQRKDFQLLFMEAERRAEAWAAEHG